MVAESPSLENSAGLASVEPSAVGWVVFVLLIGIAVLGVPLAAALIRRGLPARARAKRAVAPMSFGSSQKVSRSPRHAVLLHRSLIVTLFIALVVFLLIPGVLAIRALGVSAIQTGLALVLPTLLVTLHARRRGQGT
jgi:hypothetical protein